MSVEIQTMGEGGIFEIAAVVIDEVLEIQPFTDVEYEILSSARDILAEGSILEAATVATNSANAAAGLASEAASAANDAAGLANSAATSATSAAGAANSAASSANSAASAANSAATSATSAAGAANSAATSATTAAGAANSAASSANSAASAANTAAATAASFVGTGPAGYYATLTALQAAYPEGDTGIYVELEYGHWYYWSGIAWTDGGLFQAPLAVVQTTGTSTSDVMSQKAVTDEIAQLADDASVKINNLVINGDFNSSEGWTTTGQGTIVDGELVVTNLASGPWTQYLNASIGDMVYFGGVLYTLSEDDYPGTPLIRLRDSNTSSTVSNPTEIPTRFSDIHTIAGDEVRIQLNSHYTGTVDHHFDKIFAINLTETFGKGSEPTKEEFESLILGIDYFEGEITIPAQKVMQWQLQTLKQADNINVINVTNEYPLPPDTFYTWSTAKNAVPSAKRRLGKSITFLNADNEWENWRFTGLDVPNHWSVQNYWKRYDISEVKQELGSSLTDPINQKIVTDIHNTFAVLNVTTEYPLPEGNFYTLSTAIRAIPTARRKQGMKILFVNSENKIESWQFNHTAFSSVWTVESNWHKLSDATELTINTLDSAYPLGTYIENRAKTEVIVKAIKKVEFPYNVDNRKFYFSLLYRSGSGTNIIIRLSEYVDGAPIYIFHNSVAAVTGLNVYYLTTASGVIRLTANFDEITSSTLASTPSDPTTCFFNAISYSRPESELPKIIQESFGVFNPGVVLPSGYDDVTNQVISSILSIEMSGDWYGRKFIFTYLSIKEGKIKARFSEEFEDGTKRQVYATVAAGIDYNILDPIGTAIFDRTTTAIAYKNNLVFKLVIDNSKLPTPTGADGIIFRSRTPSEETFERMGIANEKIVDGNMPSTRVHNTIADMKNSESLAPIQFAGNLPYKLTDKTLPHPENAFVPMWNAIKGINRKPNVETKVLRPPRIEGHNNTSCVLQDIGLDDTFYIAGTEDKKGRIYTSTDFGETITEIYDLRNILESNEEPRIVWCIRELPSRELLVAMAVRDLTTTETKTKLFITSENKTVWNRVTKPDLSEFTLTHYKEVDSEDNITFEVYGRIINGWGYSAWRDYVLLTEYGYPGKSGTSTQPNVNSVGHMVTGKMYLSEDGGITFREIFDYINPPENIIFNTYPGGHHSHGCFIDQYHLTNGIPRLVGIMGDTNNRLVYSDDLGETWEDNWGLRNGTHQSVSGMATPYGYLTLPDNTITQNRNGVQLIHRGNKWENMHSDLVCNFMRPEDYTTFGGTNNIVYVGGNIFQRSPNSPILACFTPETTGRYESGARGGAVISFDGGITWEEIWRDTEVGWLRQIQDTMIWETSDGTIWLTPNALYPQNLDGLGHTGRVLKITL